VEPTLIVETCPSFLTVEQSVVFITSHVFLSVIYSGSLSKEVLSSLGIFLIVGLVGFVEFLL
jgi:hypothetical protein